MFSSLFLLPYFYPVVLLVDLGSNVVTLVLYPLYCSILLELFSSSFPFRFLSGEGSFMYQKRLATLEGATQVERRGYVLILRRLPQFLRRRPLYSAGNVQLLESYLERRVSPPPCPVRFAGRGHFDLNLLASGKSSRATLFPSLQACAGPILAEPGSG